MSSPVQVRSNWIDKAVTYLSPSRGLARTRARVQQAIIARHYEAASSGRRTQGWVRSNADPNAAVAPALAVLREHARDLVRNNGNAKGALRIIANHTVGWGISAKLQPRNKRAQELWEAWAETTACDADGINDFYGLEKLVMRTVAESGEVLVRRRFRRPEDNLPIPMQLQVLDPDYLDTSKTGLVLPNGGRIMHGIEYSPIGQRVAYWLFREHPGSEFALAEQSYRVPAEGVLHVYYKERPQQQRGPTWFAPVLLRFKDFDEYEDATLMKQKVAACLAVVTSNADGTGVVLGSTDGGDPAIDSLEPGMIANVASGSTVQVVQPPTVREYSDYSRASMRTIATGLGTTYEDLTGDYANMPFSAARMSRLAHWDRVEDWRWQMLIPQFCAPAYGWAMEVAALFGLYGRGPVPVARWSAPPAPMIDPGAEGLAHQRNIRTGLTTLYEVLRERGYDPEEVLAEYAAANKRLDELGIILDSDARMTTQAGNPRQQLQAAAGAGEGESGAGGGSSSGKPKPKPGAAEGEDEEEETEE